MHIKTEYQGSWIDNRGKRHHEWVAFDDDSYDGPGSPMGSGETQLEAIEWLYELLDERGRLSLADTMTFNKLLTELEADIARDAAVDRQP
jgi:hypothetical protein